MLLKFKITREDRLKKLLKKQKKPELIKGCLGWLYLKKGRIDKAKELSHKDNPYLAYNLALCLLKEGHKEEALELLELVLLHEPFYLGVRRKAAEIALELGDEERALKHYRFINSIYQWEDPRFQEIDMEIEVVEESPQEEEIEEEELLILDDEDFLTVEMVESYINQCLFEEAASQLEKLLELEPDNERALELKKKLEEYLSYLEPEEPAA